MKFEKFLLASLTAGLFAACSSDDPTPGPGGEDAMKGDGYVAVTINLPTTPAASRAANDQFNDGLAKEYNVKNGALLIFAGADEKAATFQKAYELTLPDEVQDVDGDNITTSFLTAIKVAKVENAANIYGLVMLNYTGAVQKIGEDGSLNIYTEATGTDTKRFTGTFEQLLSETTPRAFYSSSKDDFFMTNAPLSTVAGGTVGTPAIGDVQTLVNLTYSLKPTEEEAKASPAGSFFVERAVAKATISTTPASATIGDETLTIEGGVQWLIDNTEPTSYIVRNLGQGEYLGYENSNRGRRFVGTTVMGTTSIQPVENLFRTYWCVDPNYGVLGEGMTLNTRTDYTDADFTAAGDTPLYCHENTFSTAAQDHPHTTRALLKVTYKLEGATDGTFYTVNGVEDELYTSATDAESFSVAFILNNDEIKAAFKGAIAAGSKLVLDETNYSNYLDITFELQETGYRTVTGIKFKTHADLVNDIAWTTEQEAALCELTNGYYRIAEYTNGVNYYPLRFKHFAGDNHNDTNDLAPWDPSSIGVDNTTSAADAYPGADAEKNWLGRYGMVRNNWYDVNITAFKHLGEPALPSLDVSKDKTPDDEKETEQWIAFKVNILSWAVRKQNHEF